MRRKERAECTGGRKRVNEGRRKKNGVCGHRAHAFVCVYEWDEAKGKVNERPARESGGSRRHMQDGGREKANERRQT